MDSKNVIKDKELVGGFENFDDGLEVKIAMQGDQPQEQVDQGVSEDSKLKEELEKKIKELKEKIEKSNSKSTSFKTYFEYEKEIEELKEKLEDKEKFEKELETLEKALKEKIEKRKKELEDAQNKFKDFESQVKSTDGRTQGDQVKKQGQIGFQALKCAKELCLNVSYSSSTDTDSDQLAKKVIEDALKSIEEELKKLNNKEE
ncbi:hypothetical protein QIA46_05645 (plasmid) [Borreliella carolinensis]